MKIEKNEYSYQVTECDLKFGKQITLDGELLVSASILDKIRAEIDELEIYYDNDYFSDNKDPMYKCNEVSQIIDKYRTDKKGE